MRAVVWACLVGLALGCQKDGRSLAQPQQFLRSVTAVDSGRVFRGTFSPDGSEFYFFKKVATGGEDYRIYRVDLNEETAVDELLPLGDPDASSMYPVVSPDGALLVFSAYRGDGENADLWAALKTSAGWGEPYRLSASTAANYDASPWFDGEGALRFSSTSPDWRTTNHRRATRSGIDFGPSGPDTFWNQFALPPDHHFWSGILDPSGSVTILEVSKRGADGSLAGSDLWLSRRGADGIWSRPAPISGSVNTDATENFPAFTPDGKNLVFVRGFSGFFSVPTERLTRTNGQH